jgi:hypothetical protein
MKEALRSVQAYCKRTAYDLTGGQQMVIEKPRRTRGRQAKNPAELKSSSVTFRIPDQVKQDLEASARYHGRTLSEEIGYRLNRSFVEGSALENMSQELKYWMRDQGATEAQIEEWIAGLSRGSADAIAAPPRSSGALQPRDNLHTVIKSAVTEALREILSPHVLTGGTLELTPEDDPKA